MGEVILRAIIFVRKTSEIPNKKEALKHQTPVPVHTPGSQGPAPNKLPLTAAYRAFTVSRREPLHVN